MAGAEFFRSVTATPTVEEARLEVVPTIAGHFRSRRHRIDRRCIDEALLILVVDGAGVFRIGGGRQRPLVAGEAVLLPAGRVHDFSSDPQRGWEIRWVHYRGAYADSLARLAGFAGDHLVIPVGAAPGPARRLAAIETHLKARSPAGQLDAAVELVGLLVELKKCEAARLGDDARLLAAVEDGGGLAGMARAAGLSRFQFLRRFKRATGSTPWNWVVEQRLARAKELLIDPSCRIAEAARRSGFADPAWFSRLFHRRCGMTPRDWRARHCPLPARR